MKKAVLGVLRAVVENDCVGNLQAAVHMDSIRGKYLMKCVE